MKTIKAAFYDLAFALFLLAFYGEARRRKLERALYNSEQPCRDSDFKRRLHAYTTLTQRVSDAYEQLAKLADQNGGALDPYKAGVPFEATSLRLEATAVLPFGQSALQRLAEAYRDAGDEAEGAETFAPIPPDDSWEDYGTHDGWTGLERLTPTSSGLYVALAGPSRLGGKAFRWQLTSAAFRGLELPKGEADTLEEAQTKATAALAAYEAACEATRQANLAKAGAS